MILNNIQSNPPLILKFWVNRLPLQRTPSEQSSINTSRKSTMRFPTSLRWSSYAVPIPAKGGSKTQTDVFDNLCSPCNGRKNRKNRI